MSEKISSPQIHPASALVIRADTSIAEAVRKMRESNVGSILITSPEISDELLGIFTERDLLNKIALIESQAFWSKPIHLIMTKPVLSINITDIGKAGEIMLTKQIRHIPVTYEDDQGTKRLAGVISIRDVLRDYQLRLQQYDEWARQLPKEVQPNPALVPSKKVHIATFSKSIAFWRLMRDGKFNFPPPFNQILTDRLSMKNFIREEEQFSRLKKYDAIIIDLDGRQPQEWSHFLKLLSHQKPGGQIFVLYSPELHSERAQTIFKVLTAASKGAFEIFEKPIEIFELLIKVPKLGK